MKKPYNYISQKVFFNLILRYLLEAYLILLIGSFLNLKNVIIKYYISIYYSYLMQIQVNSFPQYFQ